MTALQQWQEQVVACRNNRAESDDKVWQRMASWYDNWVRHNDYVDLIMPRLLAHLHPDARVLEIGPGSGAFTIPLAAQVREVIAVEASAAVREVLAHKLATAGITNVRIVPHRAEEYLAALTDDFELALASFSLYNVEPLDVVIQNLVRLARRAFFLMGTADQREWYQDLHRQLKGRDRVAPPQFHPFYAVLLEMGIYADGEILWTSANYVFDSEDELVDYWLRHFHLDQTYRAMLRDSLSRVAERRGDQIGIYDRRRTALVQIDRARNLFAS